MPGRASPTAALDTRTHPSGTVLLRVLWVLLAAAAAAAGLAAVKGRGLDAAYVVGNSAAAYLLLPLLAGRLMPRRSQAIVLGIASTVIALIAFYWTASTLYLGRLSLDLSLGRWFLAGVVTGAVLGILGHAARVRPRLLYLVPVLLVLEPAATAAAAAVGLGSGAPPEALLAGAALEAALGLAALLLLLRLQRRPVEPS